MTVSSKSVVLFLDFDGVLHPRGGAAAGERFSKRPFLEALLRESSLQHVVIVISSTWREAYPLKSLVGVFSEDIQPKVIGATPILGDSTTEYLRYREIREWLNNHPVISRWVALDDAAEDFPHGKRTNVVFTDPDVGLERETINSLRRLLEQI